VIVSECELRSFTANNETGKRGLRGQGVAEGDSLVVGSKDDLHSPMKRIRFLQINDELIEVIPNDFTLAADRFPNAVAAADGLPADNEIAVQQAAGQVQSETRICQNCATLEVNVVNRTTLAFAESLQFEVNHGLAIRRPDFQSITSNSRYQRQSDKNLQEHSYSLAAQLPVGSPTIPFTSKAIQPTVRHLEWRNED
jgi:hypothetical protein